MTSATNPMSSKAGRISFADPKEDIEQEDVEEEFQKFNFTKVELKNSIYFVEFKTVSEALSIVQKEIVIKGKKLKFKYAPLPPKIMSPVITIFITISYHNKKIIQNISIFRMKLLSRVSSGLRRKQTMVLYFGTM